MRSGPPLWLLLVGLLAACGGDADAPRYELFSITLLDQAEAARVVPGTALAYRTQYVGELARNLRYTARFTHEASGETASFEWGDNIQDTARLDERGSWFLRHEFLKKSGRIRVQLQASLTSTRNGSKPWVVSSQSVYVELYPQLERVEVRPLVPGQPLAYGTPLEVRVTGKDLYGDVALTVLDVERDAPVPELARALKFDGSQLTLASTSPLRALALERIGTHPLRLVARYGDLQLEAEPLSVLVTHTLDSVTVVLRDTAGAIGPPTVPYPRLDRVSEVGLRISGTQLAGHDLAVNGAGPTRAAGDDVELLLLVPETRDFASGQGRRSYDFLVQSGGIERRASVTLQRWGIESCEWRTSEGRPFAEGENVNRGTSVVMYARLWGFPDTSGWLFKSPRSEFTVWERDPGGRPTPEQVDSLKNNDDEIDSSKADVRSSETADAWTTVYEDEFDLLDLHTNAAEFYFDVQVEDQVCSSGEIHVY